MKILNARVGGFGMIFAVCRLLLVANAAWGISAQVRVFTDLLRFDESRLRIGSYPHEPSTLR